MCVKETPPTAVHARTTQLWAMLVPHPTPKQYEKTLKWQTRVLDLAKGFTMIETKCFGYWAGPYGTVPEPVIEVRVACDIETMKLVAEGVREALDQYSVAYWLVSDEFRRTAWDSGKET